MRLIPLLVAICAAAVLTGCATPKDFYAVGGSRADGTVDMAYDFAQFEKPVVNKSQADRLANQKCSVWGYSSAEPFGGQTTNCQIRDGWGNCTAGQVIVKYQCLGDLDAAPSITTQPQDSAGVDLTKEQWQQRQLQKLLEDTSLDYEEYVARRRQILAQ